MEQDKEERRGRHHQTDGQVVLLLAVRGRMDRWGKEASPEEVTSV